MVGWEKISNEVCKGEGLMKVPVLYLIKYFLPDNVFILENLIIYFKSVIFLLQ